MWRLSQTTMQETCSVSQKMISFRWWVAQKREEWSTDWLKIFQVGLVDGVRLHNDLHMRPVAPRWIFSTKLCYISPTSGSWCHNVFKRNHLLALRLILYLAQRGETVFSPVLLLEVTVAELISSVAELLQVDDFVKYNAFHNTKSFPQVPVGLFNKVIIVGPKKIQIKLTDDFLRYQRPDSAFHYNLVHEEGTCTIQMEPVHDWVRLATIWEAMIFPSWLVVVYHSPQDDIWAVIVQTVDFLEVTILQVDFWEEIVQKLTFKKWSSSILLLNFAKCLPSCPAAI